MQLTFLYDIKRDIYNWQNSISSESYGVTWKNFLPDDISVAEVNDSNTLEKYIKKHYYQSKKITKFIEWLKCAVNTKQIQEDLETLMGKKFSLDVITIFITTFHRAPYDVKNNFFFLILREKNRERCITNIYHELMHFLFYLYFWKQCQEAGLAEQQIHTLKESATVLLNPILHKRRLPEDFGYDKHKKIRITFEHLWKEKKNFQLVLEAVLKESSI